MAASTPAESGAPPGPAGRPGLRCMRKAVKVRRCLVQGPVQELDVASGREPFIQDQGTGIRHLPRQESSISAGMSCSDTGPSAVSAMGLSDRIDRASAWISPRVTPSTAATTSLIGMFRPK